jgi:glyoxylase-like metal-dependent hydrolase (beta-lactamase superfamily II)
LEKIQEGVYLIDTLALGQKGTVAVYLVKDKKNAIIDCGYASSYKNVLDALSFNGIEPEDIDYIIPTHVHLDHGGATGHLANVMKNAEIIAHERAVPHLINPEKLIASATQVFGKEIVELYGIPLPVEQPRITPVKDELQLNLGSKTLVIIHSPGHAPHQVSVSIEGTGILVTADSVGIIYPDVGVMIPTTPPPSFDPDTLISTLNKLRQNLIKQLLIPHFGVRTDYEDVFEKTKEKVRGWVRGVEKMEKEGLAIEKIQQEMEKNIMAEAGLADLPIYASISIRTSILGILNYIKRRS